LIPNDPKKYDIIRHTVQTDDGHLLTMFQIKLIDTLREKLTDVHKENTKKVMLFFHALNDSSDTLFWHPEMILSFIDRGLEVWTGNNRGNKYSREHINSQITDKEFFDYSSDELGLLDVPAFIKYVKQQTGVEKMYMGGASQGTTQFFVAGLDATTRD